MGHGTDSQLHIQMCCKGPKYAHSTGDRKVDFCDECVMERILSFTSRCVVRDLSTLIQQGIERGSSRVCLLSMGRLAASIPNH